MNRLLNLSKRDSLSSPLTFNIKEFKGLWGRSWCRIVGIEEGQVSWMWIRRLVVPWITWEKREVVLVLAGC